MGDVVGGPVVADTDIVIDWLRGRGPGRNVLRGLLEDGRLRLTAVTAFELRVGTGFLERSDRIRALLARRTLPLDLRAALTAGGIYERLRTGAQIGLKDTLQAGICLRYGLPLATRNVRHFGRVEGLELADLEG